MARPILIHLTAREIDYADGCGLVRRGRALMVGSEHTNGWLPTFEQALWKNRQSARCEHAGEKWLRPIPWNRVEPEGIGMADLGCFIDVKGVEEAHHRLLVQEDADNDHAYLLVDSWQHPQYAIVGWLWGREAKRAEWWDPRGLQDGRPCFVVPRSSPPMRNPQELFEEWKRQGGDL
jgi:hypothetical protein